MNNNTNFTCLLWEFLGLSTIEHLVLNKCLKKKVFKELLGPKELPVSATTILRSPGHESLLLLPCLWTFNGVSLVCQLNPSTWCLQIPTNLYFKKWGESALQCYLILILQNCGSLTRFPIELRWQTSR